MQILPNIYLLDGFAYAQHANFYLVQSETVTIVIDAGTVPEDLDRAEQHLAVWGLSLEKVDYLLLTHSHYDHVGNAAALRDRGARVVAGPGDTEGIVTANWRTAPYAAGFQVPPCKVDRTVHDGDRIKVCDFEFEVLHVPGHTDGSVIYQLQHAGKIIWFAGDVVMAKNSDFEPELGWQGGEDFDRSTYLKSLRRVAALPVDVLLAGHYQPYLRDGHRLVGRAYVKALVEWR